MNYDLALISAVLADPESGYAEAIKLGVKPKFLGLEAQAYWDIITDHYEQFHEVPSLDYFQSICPSYDHRPTRDGLEAVAHELKTRYLFSEIEDALKEVADVNAADPWEARDKLARLSDTIIIDVQRKNTDLVAGEDKAEVLRRLEFLRSNRGLLGYPWPWDFFNANSPGVCLGNFIYFYGREGVRKTFLLCFLANWFESQGLRVLFCTREMTLEEIAWRLYPMRLQIPYGNMTSGQISADGQVKLEETLDDLYSRKNIIVTEIEGGLAGLRAKIEEVKPHVVIHDYMFALAEDELEMSGKAREHEAIGTVANGLKRLAMRVKVPIIACGHANRDGVKLKGQNSTEYAGSDKIARRADYGMRIITDDATDRMAIILNKGRQARKMLSFTIDATLCNGFGTYIDDNTEWVHGLDEKKSAEAESQERSNNKPEQKNIPRLNADSFGGKRGGTVFRAGG